MTGSATGAASTSATASASKIVSVIGLVFMRVGELKGLHLGYEILNLGLHRGVGLIVGCKFNCMLVGSGCAFVLIALEARHHLIYNGVGVVEAQLVNCSAGLPEFKVSFSVVVLEVIPCFVFRVGAFPRLDFVFGNELSMEDN